MYYVVPNFNLLCIVKLNCIVVYCIVLYCNHLCRVVLCIMALHFIELHCILLNCIAMQNKQSNLPNIWRALSQVLVDLSVNKFALETSI